MAGKTKPPTNKGQYQPLNGQSDSNNALLTGVIIFVLFLVGVWLFATPAHPANTAQVAKTEEVLPPTPVATEVATTTAVEDESSSGAEPAAASSNSESEESPAQETPSDVATAELTSETEPASGLANQASESKEEKELEAAEAQASTPAASSSSSSSKEYTFPLCTEQKDDNIPCLDNEKAINALKSTAHYEHRERHCPEKGEYPRCVLPLPAGYKPHINWPESRDQIWYNNVPKPSLANYKADQNWVKAEGDKFIFPGGGTQFKFGATKYIEWVQETCPELAWGKHVHVGLDMGCGVASFGAYLDQFDTKIMSVAPKDEHDAQIQFALERGVSALVGVMGTQRQPYPANVYDAVHCARCRVPWHIEGGKLLLELNRLIRPGGYFVWSATPLCFDCAASEPDDHEVWEAMKDLTEKMCWRTVVKKVDHDNWGIGVLVWQKPMDNECYDNRPEGTIPPMCPEDDNGDAAWYVPMQACLHRVPTSSSSHGSEWPVEGRSRLTTAPKWLKAMEKGVYGKNAYEEFESDTQHWQTVTKTYLNDFGIVWENVRNVMDMDAHYGGFGAALSDLPLWSMNVVPIISPDTLPVIFDRGLLGIYHDWCEAFNTYPRTYDLLHADHILGHQAKGGKCEITDVMLEMDRIVRPMGYVIIRDHADYSAEIEGVAKGLHWEPLKSFKEGGEVLLAYQKTLWRPAIAA